MIPAVALAVVAFIAGKPATVVCNTDGYNGPPAPAGYVVEGWTTPGTSTIHLNAAMCDGLSAKPGTVAFARALRVVIHESAHARGTRVEACAELWADLIVYDVLRRFYNIDFYTPLSQTIGAQVLDETHRRPASYQPTLSSCG